MEIIWILLCFIFGFLITLVGLPPLLGYLTAGFILTAVFGFEVTPVLSDIAYYGILFLLFSLGLKMRWRNMVQPTVFVSSISQIVLSVLLISTLFWLILPEGEMTLNERLFAALLLGGASSVIAAKGLEDRGDLDAYSGKLAISISIIEDIILIGIMALIGFSEPSWYMLFLVFLPLLRPVLLWLMEQIYIEELQLLFGLLAALGGASLFEFLGLGGELGAFITGLLFSGHEASEILSEKLWSFKEAFLVGFFLMIGLSITPDLPAFIAALILLIYLPLRVAIYFGIISLFRLRARSSFLTGITLSSYSEFALITGAVAAQAGYIPQQILVLIAITVGLSFLAGAQLNRNANTLYTKLFPFLKQFETKKKRSDSEAKTFGNAEYIVVGMGLSGTAAYDYLHNQGLSVVGLDSDPGKLKKHIDQRRRVTYGDAKNSSFWEELDMGKIKGIVLAFTDTKSKIDAIEALRKKKFTGTVSTLSTGDKDEKILLESGVNVICNPNIQAGIDMAQRIVGEAVFPVDPLDQS